MSHPCRVLAIVVALFAVASCVIVPPPSGSSSDTTAEPAVDGEGVDPGGTTEEPSETPDEAPQDAITTQAPSDVPADDQLPTRLLAAGDQSAVRIPATVAITTRSVFQEVWSVIHANQGEPPALPEVDFASETVVVVILGERPTAGWSVRFATVRKAASGIEAWIEVRPPSAGSTNAAVLTSLYEISAVGVAGEPVSFAGDDIAEGFDTE